MNAYSASGSCASGDGGIGTGWDDVGCAPGCDVQPPPNPGMTRKNPSRFTGRKRLTDVSTVPQDPNLNPLPEGVSQEGSGKMPRPDWRALAAVGLWETCRECRDEQPYGALSVIADFILWGKLFSPEALGPRCYDHAAKHIGWANMSRLDQCAVFDLRAAREAWGRHLDGGAA